MLNNFPIVLTLEYVDAIKRDLAKSLSHVKSSHRVEALARSCGFSTYAALNAALKEKGAIKVRINWPSFYGYLKSKDFDVAAAPLYKAAGYVAICMSMEKERFLTDYGMGIPDAKPKPDGSRETPEERRERFKTKRKLLLLSVEQFLRAYVFASLVKKIKTIDTRNSSYGLKHLAEKYPCTYPDGQELGPDYVGNGPMIAAAVHAGFSIEKHYGSPNPSFNMSRKSVRLFRQKIDEYRKNGDESIFDTFKTNPAKAA
ncbi:MAG: hypothetical protein H6858_03105 [Rhodospirillales bacterium]|nr:hypothetical protein [Alphaproteobacteria bacterium]MCB9976570.1 hypothetical protein [Rhodospirillales bacterium]